jgi:hypothetical protein
MCALAAVLTQSHRVDEASRCASDVERLAGEAGNEARMLALSFMAE